MNAIETLNHWGGHFAGFALPMLVQSSLLIVLLFALDLVLRNRVRAVVRYALWMLVLIKLVLPPSFAAPTGLAYWLPQRTAVKAPPAPPAQFVVRYSDVKFDETRPLPSLPPPRAKLQFAGWLLLGWLATAVGLMAWLVRRSPCVVRTAARALAASESPEQLLDACLQQMGIKQRVRLKLSVTPGSPAVCGLWRPVILIPQQLVDKLSALQLRAVLLHELAHIKRSDVLVHYAQTLLQIIYWWHPLLWLANAQIRRVREQAVDELVMIRMGVEAETYPTTLLEVAKLAFKRPMLALGLIGIVESKSALAQRIHRMINRPVPRSARLGFTGLAALLLAGAAFLPMARGQRTLSQPPPVVSAPDQQPAVVGMDVKFIEIQESELAALGLGEPTLTEFNGHRAWALTPEQLNGVLQRALEQTGADVLAANRVTTLSGRQSQIQIVDIAPVEGTEIRVGPTCNLIPIVSGELIDLAVVASVTERRLVDPTAPFTTVADAFLTNDVGTARVIVGDGGGVVLENPEARSSKGNRYLVLVSTTIVSADRAAESQTLNQASTAATGAATQKQEAPAATFQHTTPTPQTKSEKVRPIVAATKGDASEGERELLTVTIAKSEPHLYIGSESVTVEELKTRLQRAAYINPAVTLSLRTDKDAPFGEVVKVMDAAKEAGIKSVSAFTGAQPTNSSNVQPAGAVAKDDSNPPSDGLGSTHSSATNKVPLLGDLPFLGWLFRSDAKSNTLREKRIRTKLNEIVLPEVMFDNTPLPEALRKLCEQACERDPEGQGVNFLLNPNVVGTALPTTMEPTTVDPITGKPITLPPPAPLDMSTVVVRINPPLQNVRLADALGAIVRVADKPIRYSIEDYAVVFSPKPPDTRQLDTRQLETRLFRVNPATLSEGLKNTPGVARLSGTINSVQEAVRSFFTAAGVDVQPPNMVFFNDRTGVLMVRATAREMLTVQNALDVLNYSPPQITLVARFMELSAEAIRKLGLDIPPPKQDSHSWTGILTAAQMQAVLREAEQLAGVDILTAPKVTTLSGRQTQIQVVEVRKIVTGVKPEALRPPGVQSTNGVKASPFTVSPVPVGPVLDVTPDVASDGYTIGLRAVPTVTEFLRYDTKLGEANKRRVWVDGKEQKVPSPLPIIRTRSMQAEVDVYDGQTLVLGNPTVTVIAQQPNGQSVTNVVPEDTGKRLLVFITPTIIDPAGNPIHAPGKEPFPTDRIPPQPSR